MLEARELTKKYGSRTVVDHLSFTIRERQICGFLGGKRRGKIHDHEYADGLSGAYVR